MKRQSEPIDWEPQKDSSEIVQFYGQNEELLRQAIKDLEIRIAQRTQQIEKDRNVLEQLIRKLASLETKP